MLSLKRYSGSMFSLDWDGGDVFTQPVKWVNVFIETVRGLCSLKRYVFTLTVQWINVFTETVRGRCRYSGSMSSLKHYGGDVFTQTVQWVDVLMWDGTGGSVDSDGRFALEG